MIQEVWLPEHQFGAHSTKCRLRKNLRIRHLVRRNPDKQKVFVKEFKKSL